MRAFLITFCLLFTVSSAQADNLFCTTDLDLQNLANDHANDLQDLRDNYPACDVDARIIDAQDPVSEMINICCVGSDDATWDSCFRARAREVRRAKALPLKFRKHVRQQVLAYIENPELECTEH